MGADFVLIGEAEQSLVDLVRISLTRGELRCRNIRASHPRRRGQRGRA